MKKLLGILVLGILLIVPTITTNCLAENANQNRLIELKDIYEKGGISEAEYKAAEKLFLSKEDKSDKKKKSFSFKKKSKKINNLFKKKEEDPITIDDLEDLGVYVKLQVSDYPKEMYLELTKGCKSNMCISKKASQRMGSIFKRSPEWADKNPGQLIKAMGYYELLYWDNLRKKRKNLQRYRKNFHNNYILKKTDESNVRSLLGLNKGRKKMRGALGMNIKLPVKDALKKYWVLGAFLDLGEGKNLKKISPELKKRRKLLADYKNNISSLKKKLEEDNKKK